MKFLFQYRAFFNSTSGTFANKKFTTAPSKKAVSNIFAQCEEQPFLICDIYIKGGTRSYKLRKNAMTNK